MLFSRAPAGCVGSTCKAESAGSGVEPGAGDPVACVVSSTGIHVVPRLDDGRVKTCGFQEALNRMRNVSSREGVAVGIGVGERCAVEPHGKCRAIRSSSDPVSWGAVGPQPGHIFTGTWPGLLAGEKAAPPKHRVGLS